MPRRSTRRSFDRIQSSCAALAVLLAAGCSSPPKVAKPEAPEILGFTAGASEVVAGTGTTLVAYFAGGSGTIDGGVGKVASGRPIPVTPTKTTTYTLTVKGAGGTATATTEVAVVAGASLTVTLSGAVPPSPAVVVDGPGGPMAVLSKTTTLTGLAPGLYQVAAAPTVAQGIGYTPDVTGAPVTLAAGGSGTVGVAWRSSNTPPTIDPVADQAVIQGTPTVVDLTIGDDQDPASALTVTATAGDATVLPPASLVLGGSGSARTLTLTAGSSTGMTLVHLAVTDGAGNTARTAFRAEVVTALVTNGDDAGGGSLRAVVGAASDGATVGFEPGLTGTIVLTSGAIAVSKGLRILGPGADVLAIDGDHRSGIFRVHGSGTLTVSGLTLQHADQAIGVADGGVLDASDCAFVDNEAVAGAAIDDRGQASVTRSLFTGNVSDSDTGGAVRMLGTGSVSFTVSDSTFVANVAKAPGGAYGAAIADTAGALVVRGCTITGNLCEGANCDGEALFVSPFPPAPTQGSPPTSVALTGSIVAGNTGGSPADLKVFGITTKVTADAYNVLGSVAGFTPTSTDANNVTNPALSTLGAYGGPTETVVPLSGSPALDRVPLSAFGTDLVDQRGNPRRADGANAKSDAGAVDRLPTDPTQ